MHAQIDNAALGVLSTYAAACKRAPWMMAAPACKAGISAGQVPWLSSLHTSILATTVCQHA